VMAHVIGRCGFGFEAGWLIGTPLRGRPPRREVALITTRGYFVTLMRYIVRQNRKIDKTYRHRSNSLRNQPKTSKGPLLSLTILSSDPAARTSTSPRQPRAPAPTCRPARHAARVRLRAVIAVTCTCAGTHISPPCRG